MLHQACQLGSKIAEFIIKEADRLGIRHILVTTKDSLDRTPLFLLCKQGMQLQGQCDDFRNDLGYHFHDDEDEGHIFHKPENIQKQEKN